MFHRSLSYFSLIQYYIVRFSFTFFSLHLHSYIQYIHFFYLRWFIICIKKIALFSFGNVNVKSMFAKCWTKFHFLPFAFVKNAYHLKNVIAFCCAVVALLSSSSPFFCSFIFCFLHSMCIPEQLAAPFNNEVILLFIS